MDWHICQDLLSTKSRQKWICRDAIDYLSMAKIPRWIENILAKQKVARWIEETIEHLSRQSPESLMDWECVNFCQEKKKERLDRNESVEVCREAVKLEENEFFKKRKNTKRWMQQASYSNLDPIIKLSSQKHLFTRKSKAFIEPKTDTHTHTHNKSNQFYISKTSYDSLVSIYYDELCVKNVTSVHKFLILWRFEI